MYPGPGLRILRPSGGIDMSGLLPRYINIWRGAWITASIGIAICPWHLLSSGSKFVTVLSSFSVFVGPLTVSLPDRFFSPPPAADAFCDSGRHDLRVHRRAKEGAPPHPPLHAKQHVHLLVHLRRQLQGRRFVAHGRLASHACVVCPSRRHPPDADERRSAGFIAAISGPGFADPTGKLVPIAVGWTRLYNIAWPLGFTLSPSSSSLPPLPRSPPADVPPRRPGFLTHALLNRFFPPVGLGETDPTDVFGTFGPAEPSDEFAAMPQTDFQKDEASSTEEYPEKKDELV